MSLATSAVAVMLPVDDVDRARKFYVESLGLDYSGTNEEGSAMFDLGGGPRWCCCHVQEVNVPTARR